MSQSPIEISVIIVNYNVKHFLEQCLNSVMTALNHARGEVFVVDNNSIDGSMKMVKEKFPDVIRIENKENVGFSKANNQALRICKGKYALLLNPDTIVEEDTFSKIIQFMDQHPEAGGLGVRMIDGKGRFLPESKRGIPTPAVAFYKIFGWSKLFPKSKKFGKYHLRYLSEFKTHEVEILSGAFMLIRKEALDKVGLLDESFFMYGEDIDLSYRIILGGYKNYYFPETRIIHYKGESTKKSSVNYVFVFYNAMVIFAKKHFSQKHAKLFRFFINLAIYVRASMSILSRLIKRLLIPTLDFLVLGTGSYLLTHYWQKNGIYFPSNLLKAFLPIYLLSWMLSTYFFGGYDKNPKVINFLKSVIYGTGILLIGYALLPKYFQFSRLYILICAFWVLSYYLISRLLFTWLSPRHFQFGNTSNKKIIVVGGMEESQRVNALLKRMGKTHFETYFVSSEEEYTSQQIGRINQLEMLVKTNKINEIIFCAKDCSATTIFLSMNELQNLNLDFKIAQPDTLYLVGSSTIETSDDAYSLSLNQINSEKNKRNKRAFDLVVSSLLLMSSPIVIWRFQRKRKYLINLLNVLVGKCSFVGYRFEENNLHFDQLPRIKRGILSVENLSSTPDDTNITNKINLIYARDYSLKLDFHLLLKNFGHLDT